MLYCETTAERAVRSIFAIAPSVCELAPFAVIGRFLSVFSESLCYCGVCITIAYEAPLSGLRK